MATMITAVKLKIVGSSVPGESNVTVTYDVAFDTYDQAADQPYFEKITLRGVDNFTGEGGGEDYLTTLVSPHPDHPSPHIVRASMINPPATQLSRSFTRTISNSILNEDKAGVPNPDEIRAVVELTPRLPKTITALSNVTAIVLS